MGTTHATDTALMLRIATVRNAGEHLYDVDRQRAVLLLAMADIAADCHRTQVNAPDAATAEAVATELMRWGPAFEAAYRLAMASPHEPAYTCPRCDGTSRTHPRLRAIGAGPDHRCDHPYHRPEETG